MLIKGYIKHDDCQHIEYGCQTDPSIRKNYINIVRKFLENIRVLNLSALIF